MRGRSKKQVKHAYNVAYYRAHKHKLRADSAAWRKANRGKVRTRNAAYYAANRDKIRKKSKAAYRPGQATARSRAYYEANTAACRARSAAYQKANLEKVLAYQKSYNKKNRQKVAARNAAYQKSHPTECRVYNHKRRAAERNATIDAFTADELKAHLANLGYRCIYCGGPYEHIDHFVPLSKGGAHALSNLVPSCRSCNLRKGNKMPTAWHHRKLRIARKLPSVESRVTGHRHSTRLARSTSPPLRLPAQLSPAAHQ